jgi:hypothetical protein
MASPAGPYKVAQEAALRASADLASAMGGTLRIYTEVPANAPLPYLVIGQDEVRQDKSGCAVEAEVTSTVTLWSRPSPLDKGAQARAMGAAIVEALGVDLIVSGWDVMVLENQLSEQYTAQADQSTRGALTFEYLLTEQGA